MGMGRAIRQFGLKGDKSAAHRVLDHDGGLVRRIRVGIALLVVAEHGHWSRTDASGNVIEEDDVSTHLVVITAPRWGHHAVSDPDVDKGSRHLGSHLKRKERSVAPALIRRRIGRDFVRARLPQPESNLELEDPVENLIGNDICRARHPATHWHSNWYTLGRLHSVYR